MALSYAIVKKSVEGNVRRNLVDVTIGAAGDYSSGLTIDPVACGLQSALDCVNAVGANVGITMLFDPVSLKLRCYKTAGGAGVHVECAGADVATKIVRIEALEYANG